MKGITCCMLQETATGKQVCQHLLSVSQEARDRCKTQAVFAEGQLSPRESQLLSASKCLSWPVPEETTSRCPPDGQLPVLEVNDGLHHAIHADHLAAAKVERLLEVRLGDAQYALHTVIDVGEATGKG